MQKQSTICEKQKNYLTSDVIQPSFKIPGFSFDCGKWDLCEKNQNWKIEKCWTSRCGKDANSTFLVCTKTTTAWTKKKMDRICHAETQVIVPRKFQTRKTNLHKNNWNRQWGNLNVASQFQQKNENVATNHCFHRECYGVMISWFKHRTNAAFAPWNFIWLRIIKKRNRAITKTANEWQKLPQNPKQKKRNNSFVIAAKTQSERAQKEHDNLRPSHLHKNLLGVSDNLWRKRKPLPPASLCKAGGEAVRAPRFVNFSKVSELLSFCFKMCTTLVKKASLGDSSPTFLSAEKSSKTFSAKMFCHLRNLRAVSVLIA